MKEVFSNVLKRHKHAKWANGHFNKKVASLPGKMSVSFVLLITGTLPETEGKKTLPHFLCLFIGLREGKGPIPGHTSKREDRKGQ